MRVAGPKLLPVTSEIRLARAVTEAVPAIWVWDVATQQFLATDRVYDIYGLQRGNPLDLDTFLSRTEPQDVAWSQGLKLGLARIQTEATRQYRIQRADNRERRWLRVKIETHLAPESDTVVGYTGTIDDVTNEVLASHALAESEERLRLAIEAGRMALWEVDLETATVTVTPELNLLFGFPAETRPTLADYRSRYAPGELERLAKEGATLELVQERFARGEFEPRKGRLPPESDRTQVQAEVSIVIPGGTTKRLLYRAQYAYSPEGRPKITGLLVDITERKVAEDRLATVARELQHRVKNLLAIVQALAQQSMYAALDPHEGLQSFLERLRALSAAHDAIVSTGSEEASLAELIESVTRPYRLAAYDPFVIQGTEVFLPSKMAATIGLALHELCTNAVKYGALSLPTGSVHLEWKVDRDTLTVEWEESGGPAVHPPARRGFGTKLIEAMISRELGGSVEFGFESTGMSWRIVISRQRE